MGARYIKFVIVKLILVLFAAVGAALTSFLLASTISDTADAMFRAVMTSVVPSLVFFAFIYSFESKIKIPDDAELSSKYFLLFALRETSVYAIFQLPVTALAAVLGKGIIDGGIAAYFLLPHLVAVRYDLPLIVNYLFFCALYAAVCTTAHYMRSKKPAPPAESDSVGVSDITDTDSEEEENAD